MDWEADADNNPYVVLKHALSGVLLQLPSQTENSLEVNEKKKNATE